MAKTEKFSVVFELPRDIEVGSIVKQKGKVLTITSIRKIECISSRWILVSGNATVQKWGEADMKRIGINDKCIGCGAKVDDPDCLVYEEGRYYHCKNFDHSTDPGHYT